ncbi:MAG TPA: exodeoxyribonuclease VII small subunit [Treponema sp.]|nr:exodeoxyribonuclease VII small subunit [Treponema sp.]
MKKFEERLERLEELSESIRDSALPLESALNYFEEGINLARSLEKDIDKIEGKIQILMKEPTVTNDKPELELFAEQDLNDA